MKQWIALIAVAAVSLGLTGCVTRSYTDEPELRGARAKQGYGSSGDAEVKAKKRIWFWQDEFRNP